MHLVGAALTFGVGALYVFAQTLLSYHMQPHIHSKSMFWTRLSLGLWTLASIISSILHRHHHKMPQGIVGLRHLSLCFLLDSASVRVVCDHVQHVTGSRGQ